MRVVGLDLSLTSTGMSDGLTQRVVRTPPAMGCTEHRLNVILSGVTDFLRTNDPVSGLPRHPDLVVVEGAAYGARGNAVDMLAGLRWIVRTHLFRLGVPFAIVPPTALKRYVTRDGRAGKTQMVEALDHRFDLGLSNVKVKDGRYDMADALGLACMGYDYAGTGLPPVVNPFPQPDRSVLDKIEWPFLYSN